MRHLATALLCLASLVGSAYGQSDCTGDISGDGRTDGVDLAIVLTNWGPCNPGSAISGVFPPYGPAAGGTSIAIVGVDLGATASVTIDGHLAPQFSVVSTTTVIAVTPPGTGGARTIVLRNGQGQEIASSTFSYSMTSLPWATVLEQYPNPATVPSIALRNRIIETGLPWRVRDNGTGIEMLLVPPGNFQMGCSQASDAAGCEAAELPVHAVTLTGAFYIGRHEVTQAEWQAKVGWNTSYFQGSVDSPSRPVENVSWDHAQIYFLSQTGLRFPTEAEWEYAYRGGTSTAFHGFEGQAEGTNEYALVGNICWYESNSGGETHPVAGKAANGFGLHDMSGNVWEWVNDRYEAYTAKPQVNPTGAEVGGARVIRGGYWNEGASGLRASTRGPFMSDGRCPCIGFRVARNP